MIKTERLILRNWQMDDLDSLLKYGNNFNIAKNMRNRFPHPYTIEAGTVFIKLFEKEDPQKVFAIEYQGGAIGAIGIFQQEDVYIKNAELGYWIGEPFWNKGLATEAVKAMINYGFKAFEIERIYAAVFNYNDASKKVIEKAGFTIEAKLHNTIFKNGEFCDELIYSIWKKK